MSVLFLKRFFQRPLQVASIVPSSRALVEKVAGKIDFKQPRVIAEFGPGEGCHTREIARRMTHDSRLLLLELDAELASHLQQQFLDDSRVTVLHADACELPQVLIERGLQHCDYVVSGIPFSILEKAKKRELLQNTFHSLNSQPHAAFIIYQVTNELREKGHCNHFPHAESEYCLRNIPPMFVTKFYRVANGHVNGHSNGSNGHPLNGQSGH